MKNYYRPTMENLEERILLANYYWRPNANVQGALASIATNWTNDAGVQYQAGQAPGVNATLIFDGTSANSCSVTQNTTVAAIIIKNSFRFRIDLQAILTFNGIDNNLRQVPSYIDMSRTNTGIYGRPIFPDNAMPTRKATRKGVRNLSLSRLAIAFSVGHAVATSSPGATALLSDGPNHPRQTGGHAARIGVTLPTLPPFAAD